MATTAHTLPAYASLTAIYGGAVIAQPDGTDRWELHSTATGRLRATATISGGRAHLTADATGTRRTALTLMAIAPADAPAERMARLLASATELTQRSVLLAAA